MKLDAKKILTDLKKGDRERGPKTIYIHLALFDEFSKACGDVPVGKVLEAMMREFIESAEPAKKK